MNPNPTNPTTNHDATPTLRIDEREHAIIGAGTQAGPYRWRHNGSIHDPLFIDADDD